MKGISNLSVIVIIFSAIRIAIASPSMAQGPASRKKFPDFVCFICGIKSRFIKKYFYKIT
jgi:hypothetical protein